MVTDRKRDTMRRRGFERAGQKTDAFSPLRPRPRTPKRRPSKAAVRAGADELVAQYLARGGRIRTQADVDAEVMPPVVTTADLPERIQVQVCCDDCGHEATVLMLRSQIGATLRCSVCRAVSVPF